MLGACVQGSRGESDDDDYSMGSTCAGALFTYTNCDVTCSLAVTKVQYMSTDISETIFVADDAWTATVDDALVGLEGSWICDWDDVDGSESLTTGLDIACARFLPTVDESKVTDIRYDMHYTTTIGTFDDSAITVIETGDDTYTWQGAFEAATIAGAVIVSALTF